MYWLIFTSLNSNKKYKCKLISKNNRNHFKDFNRDYYLGDGFSLQVLLISTESKIELISGANPEILKRENAVGNLAKCAILYYFTSMIILAKRGRWRSLLCIQLLS